MANFYSSFELKFYVLICFGGEPATVADVILENLVEMVSNWFELKERLMFEAGFVWSNYDWDVNDTKALRRL